MCEGETAHLNVNALFGFLAVEHALDVKVGAARVLVNRRTHPFSFTIDDDVWI